jgi:hypothetical protein
MNHALQMAVNVIVSAIHVRTAAATKHEILKDI